MSLPSYFNNLLNEIQKIPGIGPRSAMKIALFLLESSDSNASALANSILEAKKNLRYCKFCGSISDDEVCGICSSNERDKTKICLIENFSDMITFEKFGFYNGLYHILGGLISPMNDITESDLNLNSLYERVKNSLSDLEIIFALPSNLDSEATFLVVKDNLLKIKSDIKISRIAIGLPVGSDIEYTDQLTLLRSFENRVSII